MLRKLLPLLVAGLIVAVALPAHDQEKSSTGGSTLEQTEIHTAGHDADLITLDFTNIDISALTKVMSELTHRNFILDERIAGKVTVMTPTRITPDEAYKVFLSALEIKGFTAVEDGKIIRIIPLNSARQSGLKVLHDGNMEGEGFVTKLIRLCFVSPQDLAKTLSPYISKDGNIIAYTATNSLIVTETVSDLRKIESLIKALDVRAPEGRSKINVYYLKHANADETANLLSALVSKIPVTQTTQSGGSAILQGTVSISSDKATNSLILVASPEDYEIIKDVIQKLDIRRRQVYVEVAILEFSLTKQHEFGLEFETYNSEGAIGGTNFGNIANVITNGPSALADLSGLTVGVVKGTFTYNGVEYLNVGGLLHALESDSDVNILSTPNIMAMDNQKAEIMVGENVPVITGQTQNAVTGSQTLFNTVNRQDVGIKLTLTPQIASGDNVRLEVNQEISDMVESSLTNSAGPTTTKRSATTTVMVKDRQTMVIGGLIQNNVDSSTSKVPFLGDIPLIGWLFRSKTASADKTNLMIFITPYIIKNEDDVRDLTRRKTDSQNNFRKEYRMKNQR
jgi:general secretion pathway protein D